MLEKLTRNKYSLLLLAVYIVALYVLLNKAIVPLVVDIVDSEMFTGDPSQSGKVTEVHDDRTAMALLQCNRFVSEKFDEDVNLNFATTGYQSWDIGFGRFLIKSFVDVAESGQPTVRKNYVCEIVHTGGDLAEQDNWELKGLALNDVKVAAGP